jgi:hypothetical protein
MAAHEILPPGSMDVDGLIEEVKTICKENARPEEAKHITFESILNNSPDEWKKLADNEEINGKIKMVAVKKMQEALENTLLLDLEGDTDLDKIASTQITNLKDSIQQNIETEVYYFFELKKFSFD